MSDATDYAALQSALRSLIRVTRYGSQLSSGKLPTIVTVTIPTAAPVPTTVVTAPWRPRRGSPVLTAAATSTVTAVTITAITVTALSVTAPRGAASPRAATRATRTN